MDFFKFYEVGGKVRDEILADIADDILIEGEGLIWDDSSED